MTSGCGLNPGIDSNVRKWYILGIKCLQERTGKEHISMIVREVIAS